MGRILLLALAAAVYPTLLAIVILILTRPHPIRLFSGYLIGGMAMSVTVGLLILAFADTSNLGTGSSSSPSPPIDLALGIALLGDLTDPRHGARPARSGAPGATKGRGRRRSRPPRRRPVTRPRNPRPSA